MTTRKPFLNILSLAILAWLSLGSALIQPGETHGAAAQTFPNAENAANQANSWPPCDVIEGKILLMGARTDIDALVNRLPNLALEQSSDMRWMQQAPLISIAPLTDPNKIELRLYSITDGTTVEDLLTKVLPTTPGYDTVIAAPNCRTFGHGHSAQGSPFAITVTDEMIDMGSDDFLHQDAFGLPPGGIDLVVGGERGPSEMGDGVTIAMFDTSPFLVPEGNSAIHTIYEPDPAFRLDVSHPVMEPTHEFTDLDNVINHGLLGASLIYGIAPESDLHLYRVLDEYGIGDTYTLIASISSFINEKFDIDRSVRCTVLNMGLGLGEDSDLANDGNPLYTTLNVASSLGVVVVASVGNDSTPEEARPSQEPASYANVIGAAASNKQGNRSCFSNKGDIAAPGGDAQENDDGEACTVLSNDDFVIGPAIADRDIPAGAGATFYTAHAAGTSFAAPAVSGLAALLLEEQKCQITPENVLNVMKEGSIDMPTMDAGIINIPATLASNELSIDIHPGWQLIGLPLLPGATPPDIALSSIAGSYDAACAYNPTSTNPWQCYLAAVDGGKLTSVGPTTGLWVHGTENATLTMKGNYPTSSNYTLTRGWNLVSFVVNNERAPDTLLDPLADTFKAVYDHTDDTADTWKTYQPGEKTPSLTRIEPGKGYWIKMTEDRTLTTTNP